MTKPEVRNPSRGLQTRSINISARGQHINEISKAIPMFSGSSYPMRLVVILTYQTGSGKFKMVASKHQFWPPSWISPFPVLSKIIPTTPIG